MDTTISQYLALESGLHGVVASGLADTREADTSQHGDKYVYNKEPIVIMCVDSGTLLIRLLLDCYMADIGFGARGKQASRL